MKVTCRVIVFCCIVSSFCFMSFGMNSSSKEKMKSIDIPFYEYPGGRYLFGFVGDKRHALVIFDKGEKKFTLINCNKPISKIYYVNKKNANGVIIFDAAAGAFVSEDKEFRTVGLNRDVVTGFIDLGTGIVKSVSIKAGPLSFSQDRKDQLYASDLSCRQYSTKNLNFLASPDGQYRAFWEKGMNRVFVFKAADGTIARTILYTYRDCIDSIRFSSDSQSMTLNQLYEYSIKEVGTFSRKSRGGAETFHVCSEKHENGEWCGRCFGGKHGLSNHRRAHKKKKQVVQPLDHKKVDQSRERREIRLSQPPPGTTRPMQLHSSHKDGNRPQVQKTLPYRQRGGLSRFNPYTSSHLLTHPQVPTLFILPTAPPKARDGVVSQRINSYGSTPGSYSSNSSDEMDKQNSFDFRLPLPSVNTFSLDNLDKNRFGAPESQNQTILLRRKRKQVVPPIEEKQSHRKDKKQVQAAVPTTKKLLDPWAALGGGEILLKTKSVGTQETKIEKKKSFPSKDSLSSQVRKQIIEDEHEELDDEFETLREGLEKRVWFNYSPNGDYLAATMFEGEMLLVFDRKTEKFNEFLFSKKRVKDFWFLGMQDFYGILVELEDGSYQMVDLFTWEILPAPEGLNSRFPWVEEKLWKKDSIILESLDKRFFVTNLGSDTYAVLDKREKKVTRQFVVPSYRGRRKNNRIVLFSEDGKRLIVKCPNNALSSKQYVFILDGQDLNEHCCVEDNQHEYVCSRYFDNKNSVNIHARVHNKRKLRKRKGGSAKKYEFTEDDAALSLIALSRKVKNSKKRKRNEWENSPNYKKIESKRKKRKIKI